MTAYETGYSAFLKGIDAKDNPFDSELAPFSRKRWDEGWSAAKKRRAEISR